MEDNLAKLPEGWAWTTYEQIGKWSGGGTPSKQIESYWSGGEIPWVSPKDMKSLQVYGSEDKITDDAIKNSSAKLIPSGSLLFVVRSGILRRTLPIALTRIDAAVNQDLKALTPSDHIFAEYLLYHALAFNNEIRRSCSKDGTTVESLEFSALKEYPVPVAPLPEQHRIVARIEELFSRLDVGVEALRRAKGQLQRYRQSVLQAAVEGRLTAEWRAAHPEVEAAQISLKQHRLSQKEELQDISDLPVLPSKWIWTTFDQVSDRVTVGHVGPMKDEYIENGIPFLRSQNVRENKFDPTGLKFISEEFNEKLKKSILHPGDLVVVRSGDVGTACVIPDTLKIANCSDLVIVKQPRAIDPRFAAYYMNSLARARVNSQQVGIALRHFNTKSMAKFPVPVPPLAEQMVIVSLVNKSLNQIDNVEAAIVPNLNYADRLRQSILQRAFQGKLVPQDPNDEPASLLLERIRVERIKEPQRRGRKSKAHQARLIQ